MTVRLLMQYIVYLCIIVFGLLILGFIKKKNRLPSHSELKIRLEALLKKINEVIELEKENSKNKYDFFKKVTNLIYILDKLIYTAAMLAEKERIVELNSISDLLNQAKNEMVPYKFGRKGKEDLSNLFAARDNVQKAIQIMVRVLERDTEFKGKKEKS